MMQFLVPLGLGVAAVAQAGLNRRLGAEHGLAAATLLNNSVLLVASVALCFANLPATLTGLRSISYSPLIALPGLLGIGIIAGVPWAIAKWGATTVFVSLIASQILSGLVWDHLFERQTFNRVQVVGIVLAFAGAVLVNVKR